MSFDFDFNNADQGRDLGGLIPDNTVVPVQISIQPGGHGDGGYETKSKSSDSVMIRFEFTVTVGPYYRRKFWDQFVIGGTNLSDKQQTSIQISKSTLRGIIESARGINPADETDQARQARRLQGWKDMDGMRFTARVGVKKSEGYPDKNILRGAVPITSPQYVQQLNTPAQSMPGWEITTGQPARTPTGNASRPVNW